MKTGQPTTCCQTPRGEKRRDMFLQAAAEVFMESGYDGASMNEIVQRAGGSLSTLYKLYGNKLGLFEAVITQKTEEFFSRYEDGTLWSADVRQSLLNFGRDVQNRLLQDESAAIFRLVVAERSSDQQKIQDFFYQAGPKRAMRVLGDYLKSQVQSGRLRPLDCQAAACQFIEMTRAPFFYSFLFGHKPDEAQMEKVLQQTVDLFLHGCANLSDTP